MEFPKLKNVILRGLGALEGLSDELGSTGGGIVGKHECPNLERNVAMRISALIISAVSLVALGSLAQADDHLFQATKSGGLIGDAENCCFTRTNKSLPDSPGRGSPNTAFEEEDLGTPSVGVDKLNEKAQEHVPFGEEE